MINKIKYKCNWYTNSIIGAIGAAVVCATGTTDSLIKSLLKSLFVSLFDWSSSPSDVND